MTSRQSRNDRHSRDDRRCRNYRSRDDRYSRSRGIPMVMRVGAHRVVGIVGMIVMGNAGDGHRQRRRSQRAGSGRNEGQRSFWSFTA